MVTNTIQRIENSMIEIITILQNISDERFSKQIERVNFLNEDILKQRKFLLSNYTDGELKKHEKKIVDLAKEIKVMFDNIITEKKEKSNFIKKDLFLVNNNRKLIKYKQV
jgi:hypothetical protein